MEKAEGQPPVMKSGAGAHFTENESVRIHGDVIASGIANKPLLQGAITGHCTPVAAT
jgi:hypothetical protein